MDVNDVQDTVAAIETALGTTSVAGTLPVGLSRVLGYAEVTADQGSISALTDLTSLTVTVTVPNLKSAHKVRITACTHWATAAATGAEVYIRESSTILQTSGIGLISTPTPGTDVLTLYTQHTFSPSAASHTYKLSAAPTSAALTLKASATRPASILVELL